MRIKSTSVLNPHSQCSRLSSRRGLVLPLTGWAEIPFWMVVWRIYGDHCQIRLAVWRWTKGIVCLWADAMAFYEWISIKRTALRLAFPWNADWVRSFSFSFFNFLLFICNLVRSRTMKELILNVAASALSFIALHVLPVNLIVEAVPESVAC